MKTEEGTALSDMIAGDLITPHSPTDAFSYVASVVLLDGALRQVPLPEVLGEYPKDPGAVSLSPEQLEAMRASATDADSIEDLLIRVDEDTFVPSAGYGVDNLRKYVAEHAPQLLDDSVLREVTRAELPRGAFDSSLLFVALILLLLASLLGVGAWVAIRVVSGY
jgi:hypothetical protein